MREPREDGFRITAGRGFQICFSTGVIISVQFGPGNYCDNSNISTSLDYRTQESECGAKGCKNAEVALMERNGGWLTKEAYRDVFNEELHDDVNGHVTPEQVAKLVAWASTVDLSTLVRCMTPEEKQALEERREELRKEVMAISERLTRVVCSNTIKGAKE